MAEWNKLNTIGFINLVLETLRFEDVDNYRDEIQLNVFWRLFGKKFTPVNFCAIVGGETKSGSQVYIQGYTI